MDGGRLGGAGPAVAVVAAALLAVAVTLGLRGDQSSRPKPATVIVDIAHPGRAVPRSFLGIATEWDSVGAYAGPAVRRRIELVSLLRAVGRGQGAPLALRIGGDSADQSWWNPRRIAPRPPTVLHDLGPRVLDDAAWLARGLGGPVTLGLNLALGDDRNAVALARALRRRIGKRLEAVELGNEPDFYARPDRRWQVPGYEHVRVRKRPPGYAPSDYGREATALLAAVRGVPGLGAPVKAIGAGFATPAWWPALPWLLRTSWPAPDVLAGHLYGFASCDGSSPGADWLMAPGRSREAAARLAPLARIAAGAGLPWRVTELNSAPCGGRAGLSDAPAAAVWLADTLFALVAAGAQQADVQTWNHARYAVVEPAGAGARPRPPLDGMLAFARAAPAGSRLARVTVTGGDEMRAWATVDGRGGVRVLVIAPRGGDVRVRLPRSGRGGCPPAWVAGAQGHTVVRPRRAGGACRLALPALTPSLAVLQAPEADGPPRARAA